MRSNFSVCCHHLTTKEIGPWSKAAWLPAHTIATGLFALLFHFSSEQKSTNSLVEFSGSNGRSLFYTTVVVFAGWCWLCVFMLGVYCAKSNRWGQGCNRCDKLPCCLQCMTWTVITLPSAAAVYVSPGLMVAILVYFPHSLPVAFALVPVLNTFLIGMDLYCCFDPHEKRENCDWIMREILCMELCGCIDEKPLQPRQERLIRPINPDRPRPRDPEPLLPARAPPRPAPGGQVFGFFMVVP